jgi:hypothetical protein
VLDDALAVGDVAGVVEDGIAEEDEVAGGHRGLRCGAGYTGGL